MGRLDKCPGFLVQEVAAKKINLNQKMYVNKYINKIIRKFILKYELTMFSIIHLLNHSF